MGVTIRLREMEVLHAVVKTGSMSGAARQLHTSQPAVSQVVRAVEERLGIQLFTRTGSSIAPTPEVLELFNELDLIFSTVDTARRLAGVLHQGAGRVLRIGAIPSLMLALVPSAAARLRADFPLVRVWIRSQEPTAVHDAVVRREFDLGIMYAEVDREGIELLDLCSAPIVCLLREDDPLARFPALTPERLSGEPLISHATMSPIGTDLDAIFAAHGSVRQLVVEIGNSHGAAGFVRAGLGVALIDPFFMGLAPLHGLVVRPFLPKRPLTPRLVHVTGRSLSKVEARFFEHLQRAAQDWLGENRGQLGRAERKRSPTDP